MVQLCITPVRRRRSFWTQPATTTSNHRKVFSKALKFSPRTTMTLCLRNSAINSKARSTTSSTKPQITQARLRKRKRSKAWSKSAFRGSICTRLRHRDSLEVVSRSEGQVLRAAEIRNKTREVRHNFFNFSHFALLRQIHCFVYMFVWVKNSIKNSKFWLSDITKFYYFCVIAAAERPFGEASPENTLA